MGEMTRLPGVGSRILGDCQLLDAAPVGMENQRG